MANKWVNLSDKERSFMNTLLSKYEDPSDKTIKAIKKKMDDSSKRIKVSSAKGKGRGLQNWVAERISNLIGEKFDNQDDEAPIRGREMGQRGTDVVLKGEARKKFPFTIECKNVETIHFRDFVDQARKYSEAGGWLLVIRTKSLPETTVSMSWGTFENLFEGKYSQKGVQR